MPKIKRKAPTLTISQINKLWDMGYRGKELDNKIKEINLTLLMDWCIEELDRIDKRPKRK